MLVNSMSVGSGGTLGWGWVYPGPCPVLSLNQPSLHHPDLQIRKLRGQNKMLLSNAPDSLILWKVSQENVTSIFQMNLHWTSSMVCLFFTQTGHESFWCACLLHRTWIIQNRIIRSSKGCWEEICHLEGPVSRYQTPIRRRLHWKMWVLGMDPGSSWDSLS